MQQAEEYARLGNTMLQRRNFPAAIAYFDAALKLDPSLEDAHFGRGFASYQLRDDATAEEALSQAIQLSADVSHRATAHFLRCLARANLGNRKGALQDYQDVASLDRHLLDLLQSQTCVGTSQMMTLAMLYPAQFALIVEHLTRA
jgi:tetratricopeptide (TPR) repeat protein